MQVEELDSNDLVNICIHGDKESLQKYRHRVVKLTARAPRVSESITINAIVGGPRAGNCQDVLDRIKPKSLQELFEVMQEYCKSDKGHHRRLDRAKATGSVGCTERMAEPPTEAVVPASQQRVHTHRPQPKQRQLRTQGRE
jgi:hypothetical protein